MSCYPLQVVSRMVMNRSGEVFYIGGNDVLPAPLEPKREAFILQKLGTGQEEEHRSRGGGSDLNRNDWAD